MGWVLRMNALHGIVELFCISQKSWSVFRFAHEFHIQKLYLQIWFESAWWKSYTNLMIRVIGMASYEPHATQTLNDTSGAPFSPLATTYAKTLHLNTKIGNIRRAWWSHFYWFSIFSQDLCFLWIYIFYHFSLVFTRSLSRSLLFPPRSLFTLPFRSRCDSYLPNSIPFAFRSHAFCVNCSKAECTSNVEFVTSVSMLVCLRCLALLMVAALNIYVMNFSNGCSQKSFHVANNNSKIDILKLLDIY